VIRLAVPWMRLGARALTGLVAVLWLAGPVTVAWPDDGGMPPGLYDGADDDTAVLPSIDPVALPEATVRLTAPRAGRPFPLATPPPSGRPGPLARPALRAPPAP
jgi:hypothetical protein